MSKCFSEAFLKQLQYLRIFKKYYKLSQAKWVRKKKKTAEKPQSIFHLLKYVATNISEKKLIASNSFSFSNSLESFSHWQTLSNPEPHREGNSGKCSSYPWKEVTMMSKRQ